jgi:hypothetical protein
MTDRDISDSSDNKKDVGSEADDKLHEVASEVAAAARAVVASVKSQGIVQSVLHWEKFWQEFWEALPKNPETGKLHTRNFNKDNWDKTEAMNKQCDARIVAFQQIGMDTQKASDVANTNLQMSDNTSTPGV